MTTATSRAALTANGAAASVTSALTAAVSKINQLCTGAGTSA
jgi:hypothetical protein